MLSWHAYFYEGFDASRPPIMSDWIEAANAEEAMSIARRRLGALRRAELVRPSWHSPAPPLTVVNLEAMQAPAYRLN